MIAEKPRTLLIVEDDQALQKQLRWSFDQFETLTAGDRESALTQVHRHNPAVVTMDLGLPPDADSVSEGFRLLEQILAVAPDTKVIVLTGQNDRANALRAIGLGAYDFFAKPFEPELLALTIDREFRLYDLQQENRRLQAAQHPPALAGLLTRNAEMLRVCRTIEKVANSSATVRLLGESGTGKEVLARGVHEASPRKAERFVAINCAAIPDNLLEAQRVIKIARAMQLVLGTAAEYSVAALPAEPQRHDYSAYMAYRLRVSEKVSFSATKKALLRALPKRPPAKSRVLTVAR